MQHEQKLQLYLMHRSALVDYAAPIVGCRSRAEDVVQEAFLRFTQSQAEIMFQPTSYLYRIVRNLAVDWARRLSSERLEPMKEDAAHEVPSGQRSPEQEVAFREELSIVTAALGELPERTQIAFRRYRLDGCTLQEIAVEMNMSVTAVHQHIHKALDHCVRSLKRKVPETVMKGRKKGVTKTS